MGKQYLMVILGVVMVSYSGPLVKGALLCGATPATVAFLRMLLSGLFLLPLSLRKRRGESHSSLGVVLQEAKGKQLALLLLSAFMLALHFFTWMTSLKATSTFASVALVCTQPLFVAAFSGLLLHEPIARRARPGALIAIIGAAIIGASGLSGDGQGTLLGDGLALVGAAAMAGHWLCGRALRRTMPATGYMVTVYLMAAVLLAATIPFSGGFALSGESIWYVLGLVFGCTLLGHALFTYSLGHVSADVVSFALLGEPVGAMVWAVILFHEMPTAYHLVGGVVILLGLCLYLVGTMRGRHRA